MHLPHLHGFLNSHIFTFCFCPANYTGKHCEVRDPCRPSPCKNLGLCHNISSTDYVCSCVHGYYGNDCEKVNICELRNPCKWGKCIHLDNNLFNCVPHSVFLYNLLDRSIDIHHLDLSNRIHYLSMGFYYNYREDDSMFRSTENCIGIWNHNSLVVCTAHYFDMERENMDPLLCSSSLSILDYIYIHMTCLSLSDIYHAYKVSRYYNY
jgi:hypothetical protein